MKTDMINIAVLLAIFGYGIFWGYKADFNGPAIFLMLVIIMALGWVTGFGVKWLFVLFT